MSRSAAPESPRNPPTELQLNRLLRSIDWRFLLRIPEVPRVLDMTGGHATAGMHFVAEAPTPERKASLVVTGFPTRSRIEKARAMLMPGGELVSAWRMPRPFGTHLARSRLRRRGFVDVEAYWPGPRPSELPRFWVPLHRPATMQRFFAMRQPEPSLTQAIERILWRAAELLGLLAPVVTVARTPYSQANAAVFDCGPEDRLADPDSLILLTGGDSIYSKVIGVGVYELEPELSTIFKFARVPASDEALDSEARALRWLERNRPELKGVPRLLATGQRAGRRATIQTALHGRPMKPMVTPDTYADFASMTTDWLIRLAGSSEPKPPSEWYSRLVAQPLETFEERFSGLVSRAELSAARELLSQLGPLPPTCEHRDLIPNNMLISESGEPLVFDWEFAEPNGLPCTDLCFFLADAAFVAEGVLNAPEAGQEPTLACHRRLLDPATPMGRTYGEVAARYCDRLGISRETFGRLRLLCWIVQAVNRVRTSFDVTHGSEIDPFHPTLFARLAVDEVNRLI